MKKPCPKNLCLAFLSFSFSLSSFIDIACWISKFLKHLWSTKSFQFSFWWETKTQENIDSQILKKIIQWQRILTHSCPRTHLSIWGQETWAIWIYGMGKSFHLDKENHELMIQTSKTNWRDKWKFPALNQEIMTSQTPIIRYENWVK